METDKHSVLVAVPTTDFQVSTGIAQVFSKMSELNYYAPKDFNWKFSTTTCQGVKGYDAARNSIAKVFLESKADYLMMIDQDMQPPENFFDIFQTETDIIAPLLPTMKIDVDYTENSTHFRLPYCACRYTDLDDIGTASGIEIEEGGQGIIDVDGVGFGCVLIKREVMEDKRMWYPMSYRRPDDHIVTLADHDPPPIFRFHKKAFGGCDIGEDFDFCRRARLNGYTVKLDTRITMGHLKWLDLSHLFDLKAFVSKFARQMEERQTA